MIVLSTVSSLALLMNSRRTSNNRRTDSWLAVSNDAAVFQLKWSGGGILVHSGRSICLSDLESNVVAVPTTPSSGTSIAAYLCSSGSEPCSATTLNAPTRRRFLSVPHSGYFLFCVLGSVRVLVIIALSSTSLLGLSQIPMELAGPYNMFLL